MKEEAQEFLDQSTLKELIRKYSQFINFPIYLWDSKTETVEEPIEVSTSCISCSFPPVVIMLCRKMKKLKRNPQRNLKLMKKMRKLKLKKKKKRNPKQKRLNTEEGVCHSCGVTVHCRWRRPYGTGY